MSRVAVIPMKLVTIVGPLEDFDNVVLDSIVNHEFHPEPASQVSKRMKFLYPFELENPYAGLLRLASATADRLDIELDFCDYASADRDRDRMEAYIRAIDKKHAGLLDERESLRRVIDEGGRIIDQLSHLKDVNIEISEFFKCKFFKFRFGYLPRDTYDNHIPLIEERGDVFFFPTSVEKTVVYGMYMMPRAVMEKVDSLFAQMQFTRIYLSGRVHGSSEQALGFILKENEEAQTRVDAIETELAAMRDSERERLLAAYSYIRLMNDSYNLRRFAAHTNESFYMLGWVPGDSVDGFIQNVAKQSPESVIVTEDPENIDDFTPPVKLKNNFLSRAFQPFLEMYGLPAYNEMDPTPFMALTYAILFGAMFGDVGQGAVLLLGGFLLWRWKGVWLARCVGYAGVCSVAFGFFYGSVFGNEHILPFGFNVLEGANATSILRYSVNAGFIMIILVMVLNVVNGIRQRDFEKILFGPSGIAGVIFYAALMGLFLPMIGFAGPTLPVWALLAIAALPFLLVFLREPLSELCARKPDWKPESAGGFVTQNIFEMIEVLLSYISNTLSYLRIGAYAISHASMMTAVYMMAEQPGGGYNIVVLVIGNAIIMGIEAFLAGIQVLRLEFYEIFSRFYAGDGKPYAPVVIDYKKRSE